MLDFGSGWASEYRDLVQDWRVVPVCIQCIEYDNTA